MLPPKVRFQDSPNDFARQVHKVHNKIGPTSVKGGGGFWRLGTLESRKISTIPTQYCVGKKREEIFSYSEYHTP